MDAKDRGRILSYLLSGRVENVPIHREGAIGEGLVNTKFRVNLHTPSFRSGGSPLDPEGLRHRRHAFGVAADGEHHLITQVL